jgi:hypothetical protein
LKEDLLGAPVQLESRSFNPVCLTHVYTRTTSNLIDAPTVLLHQVAQIETEAQEVNYRPRHRLKGHAACAVVHDDSQRLRWNLRQRQTIFRPKTIFRLLLQDFGQIIGNMVNEPHHRTATLWRLTVETWLHRQGLISVRQNQNPKVSPAFAEIWSQD